MSVMLKCTDASGADRKLELEVTYHDWVEGRNGYRYPATTVVELIETDEDGDCTVAAMGTAYCHANDQFSRKVGRKLAFERAVQAFTFTANPVVAKRMKQELWESYLAQVKV